MKEIIQTNYIVEESDLIGEIMFMPLNLVQQMVNYQQHCGNEASVKVFQNCINDQKDKGGFDRQSTLESKSYWDEIISKAYKKYYNYYDCNMYIVRPEDLKGELKFVSITLAQRMINCQIEQGNKANISIFQQNLNADKKDGGFDWDQSEEDMQYWQKILSECKNKYNKYLNSKKYINNIGINDLTGQLKKYPLYIAKRVVECQSEQGNTPDITVFQKCIVSNYKANGFDWNNTIEGFEYWYFILHTCF